MASYIMSGAAEPGLPYGAIIIPPTIIVDGNVIIVIIVIIVNIDQEIIDID